MSDFDMDAERRLSPTLDSMVREGVELTRQNWVVRAYGHEPATWGVEQEAEVPSFLQDWDQVTE